MQGHFIWASMPLFAHYTEVLGGFCASGKCHWQKERGNMHKWQNRKKTPLSRKDDLMTAAHEKYQKHAAKDDEENPPNSYAVEQTEHEQNYPESEKNARRPQDVKIHRADSTETNA